MYWIALGHDVFVIHEHRLHRISVGGIPPPPKERRSPNAIFRRTPCRAAPLVWLRKLSHCSLFVQHDLTKLVTAAGVLRLIMSEHNMAAQSLLSNRIGQPDHAYHALPSRLIASCKSSGYTAV